MNERYHNEINKRILSGNLPLERLYAMPYTKKQKADFRELAKDGLQRLFQSPDVLTRLIKYATVDDFQSWVLDIQDGDYHEVEKEFYKTNISLMLNTGYSQSSLSENGNTHKRAAELCPYVTTLDKRLWKGTFSSELLYSEDDFSMPYVCAYMLIIVQEKELSSGYTIDLDKINLSTPIMSLILEPWDKKYKDFLTEISREERDQLQLLKRKRDELSVTAENEQLETEEVARETDGEWRLFLELIYELSKREETIIERMLDKSISATEKLESIRQFEDEALAMRRGYVTIGDEQQNFNRIIEAVGKRFEGAPDLTLVRNQDGLILGLNREIVKIVERNESFNRIQIKHLQFRLDSRNIDLARELFYLSEILYKCNHYR